MFAYSLEVYRPHRGKSLNAKADEFGARGICYISENQEVRRELVSNLGLVINLKAHSCDLLPPSQSYTVLQTLNKKLWTSVKAEGTHNI